MHAYIHRYKNTDIQTKIYIYISSEKPLSWRRPQKKTEINILFHTDRAYQEALYMYL